MNYKHSCVIDSEGFYKTLVLVLLVTNKAGATRENIQYYSLKEGETLLDTQVPGGNLLKSRWNGTEWVEAASAEAVEAAEKERVAMVPPPPAPTKEQQLLEELARKQAEQAQAIEMLMQANAAQLSRVEKEQ